MPWDQLKAQLTVASCFLLPVPQYLGHMNAAFSAQRCGVVVDACVLGAGHSAFLQQVLQPSTCCCRSAARLRQASGKPECAAAAFRLPDYFPLSSGKGK